MQCKLILLVVFLCSVLSSAEIPVLKPELRAKLWKAQSEYYAAQLNLEHTAQWAAFRAAETAKDNALSEWRNACAPHTIGTDDKGDPRCVEKPKETSKREESKPKPKAP